MIHLVTDSTSDISPSDAQALGVHVVPLIVRFGEEQYRDGVDIDPDQFYAKLQHTDVHPTTSQPSPEVFATLYRTLLSDPDDQVVGLHISAKLSGTLQSATLAAQDFDPGRIHLVDTESVSGGLQLLVRAALDDIKAGDSAADGRGEGDPAAQQGHHPGAARHPHLPAPRRPDRPRPGVRRRPPQRQTADRRARRRGRAAGAAAQPRQGHRHDRRAGRGCAPLRSLAEFHAAAAESMVDLEARLGAAVSNVTAVLGRIGPVVGAYSGPGGLGVACLGAD